MGTMGNICDFNLGYSDSDMAMVQLKINTFKIL